MNTNKERSEDPIINAQTAMQWALEELASGISDGVTGPFLVMNPEGKITQLAYTDVHVKSFYNALESKFKSIHKDMHVYRLKELEEAEARGLDRAIDAIKSLHDNQD